MAALMTNHWASWDLCSVVDKLGGLLGATEIRRPAEQMGLWGAK